MMGSSVCQKIGLVLVCLAVCVFVGCGGGGGVDALAKEHKALVEEAAKAKTPEDAAKAMTKLGELMKKVMALTPEQQKEFNKAIGKG